MMFPFLYLQLGLLNARSTKIIGGEIAVAHSEPHIVSLQLRRNHFCGGSILNEVWIVSAAHCSTQPYDEVVAVAGAQNIHNATESNVRINILKFIRHQNYDSRRFVNDIAMVKLSTKLNLNGETIR